MNKKGLLIVISAPSGGGKTTILKNLFDLGYDNFRYSVSATTRPKRAGELNGRDYHFLSVDEFEKKRLSGEFVEWAEVHDNYYATLKPPIQQWLAEGKVVFCDLDVDGGLAVKKEFGDSAILIFVKPPSFESLLTRLKDRKTESDTEIEKRLQRYPKEIEQSGFYDYQIVNDKLNETVQQVITIVKNAEKSI